MKTLSISEFKTKCLGLLKDVHATGEPVAVTFRRKTLAIVRAPGERDGNRGESVGETLERLRPLLLVEEEDFTPPARASMRPDALDPFATHP